MFSNIILFKKFILSFLPPTVEPLFKYKSDADERLTIGHQDQFATQLPCNYITGIFPINEASRSWNTCPPRFKKSSKNQTIKKGLQ